MCSNVLADPLVVKNAWINVNILCSDFSTFMTHIRHAVYVWLLLISVMLVPSGSVFLVLGVNLLFVCIYLQLPPYFSSL